MSLRKWRLAAAALCVLAPPIVRAAPIVDQSNTAATFAIGGGVPSVWAQTFTVGDSGLFTGVDLRMLRVNPGADAGNFIVQIRPVTSGEPTSPLTAPVAQVQESDNVLPSESSGQSTYTGFTHIDFSSADIVVTPGEVLAVDVLGGTGTDANNGFIIAETSNSYAGGAEFDGFNDSNTWIAPGSDLAFQTYVDTAAPEPGSLLLLGAGICGLLAARVRLVGRD